MFAVFISLLLPIWTFLIFFAGVGLGSGNLTISALTDQLAKRKAMKERTKVKTGPNVCQCGCMKSFHREGKYECQAPMYSLSGELLQQSCRCMGYISSQVPEFVDIADIDRFSTAASQMQVDLGRKAIESAANLRKKAAEIEAEAKASVIHEGEIV